VRHAHPALDLQDHDAHGAQFVPGEPREAREHDGGQGDAKGAADEQVD